MDMTDTEKEERLQRQKLELERRTKIRNSRLFLLFGSIFEILETFLIIVFLFVFFFFLIVKAFKLPQEVAQTIYTFSTIVSLIGGLFLGFVIYKKCAAFVIEKFHLEDKLSNEVLGHYAKRDKKAEKEALKK